MKENYQINMAEKLAALAKSYTPEWNFSQTDPDAGSATALLIGEMLQQNIVRLNRVMHKHKIQYLNLFDRLKKEPIEAAKSYVQFSVTEGISDPVAIAKGVVLLAESEGQKMTFETTHGITVSDAQIQFICSTGKEEDRIAQLFDAQDEKKSLESCNFKAFSLSGDNIGGHALVLAFQGIFDHTNSVQFSLHIETEDQKNNERDAKALTESSFTFTMRDPVCGYVNFDSVQAQGNIIYLSKKDYRPAPVLVAGHMRYAIELRSDLPCSLEITSIHLNMKNAELLPDEVICSGISENAGRFFPFGKPMEIYSECAIDCKEAFSKKGAWIEMSFMLDFEEVLQVLPEIAQDIDYKIIMKKPQETAPISPFSIRANYVIIEYLSGSGWKRLVFDEHISHLFNNSDSEKVSIGFECPQDMFEIREEDTQNLCRLRLRLLRADNLYKIPSRQLCPVITHLSFSYTYNQRLYAPDYAVTHNNFYLKDITDHIIKHRAVRLFTEGDIDRTAMYFGFDKSPWGTPKSIYFDVENRSDYPIDFTVEYMSPIGFQPIKTVDNTGKLLYSGTILLLIPRDIVSKQMFKKDLFWLRLVKKNKAISEWNLPRIKGIYCDMARVENRLTQSEIFYVDDQDSAFHIKLSEDRLISVAVFANEESGEADAENWVKWSPRKLATQRGRYYELDLAAGVVDFPKHSFSTYRLCKENPAIKVEFQSYQGSAANLPEHTITALNGSIRYIRDVTNPVPIYGGYDGYNEQTSAAMISGLLRTRGRAVSESDYTDIIFQASYGVRRVKAISGINAYGQQEVNTVTIALLIDEYEKGGHIFSAVKDNVRQHLQSKSALLPLGGTLSLIQPYFVELSVRLWIMCENLENIYDLQQQAGDCICKFIDPLWGGFEGKGWEIGILPSARQLLAWLKTKQPNIGISRMVMTARFGEREYTVNNEIYVYIDNPFAMAVNGKHIVYVEIHED